jgi:hypothetical protein
VSRLPSRRWRSRMAKADASCCRPASSPSPRPSCRHSSRISSTARV